MKQKTMESPTLTYGYTDSPYGNLSAGYIQEKLCLLYVDGGKSKESPEKSMKRIWGKRVVMKRNDMYVYEKTREALAQLSQGKTPLLHMVGTEFQMKVWEALMKIPKGKKVTYTHIARMIGHPKAVRAAANAVGANEISIVIPCHRVVRTDGSMGGYRWGEDVKKKILDMENM